MSFLEDIKRFLLENPTLSFNVGWRNSCETSGYYLVARALGLQGSEADRKRLYMFIQRHSLLKYA